MVGFGSSLRMARRSGWEGAYLDYETLKLLLSQIEAVYEEEGHRQRQTGEVFVLEEDPLVNRRNHRGRKKFRSSTTTRDYRDELFLEPDSDKAYASVDEQEQLFSDTIESSDLREPSVQPPQAKPFSLSYSHEANSSDDEDEDDSQIEGGCGTLPPWPPWESKPSSSRSDGDRGEKVKLKKRRLVTTSTLESDAFFVKGPKSGATDAFYLAGNEEASQLDELQKPSIFNAPVLRTHDAEGSALLPPATPATPPAGNSTLYAFSGTGSGNESITPPRSFTYWNDTSIESRGSTTATSPPVVPPLSKKRLEAERKKQRKLRRNQRRRRREREKRVPRHIRVAHSKARDITERFLGLLRAETEKVLLFAQSRLGELADTAGSLRFASFDDNEFAQAYQDAPAYDYPLSDSGRHPSASSSDDEGAPCGQGLYPWSDSSNEEDDSHASQRGASGISKTFSDDVAPASRRSTPQNSNRKVSAGDQMKTNGNLLTVQRQLEHFAELRRSRPVFQRNDHILGEDMLLISAVDEADGYTAVGVELLHVLRFICVNLIAVRKICRKHDRLLMNRMLGGYYHRSYSHIEDAHTLGGLLARISGDIYEAHPALIGQRNHFKLVGFYDRKIQKLANSRTVQVVSSCLGLALSEYEVARSRADALTKLNSSVSDEKTPRASGKGPSFSPCAGLNNVGGVQSVLASDDDEELPSTASSLSLTRLRFTVTSIFALREAARCKLDGYGTYLTRSAMVFTGQAVGEGLDGCSRATLDFIVSYNPDSALLLNSKILFDAGLRKCRWMQLPMSDVMISALATLTFAPDNVEPDVASTMISLEETIVSNAVSIQPEPRSIMGDIWNFRFPAGAQRRSRALVDLPSAVLRLNEMSCFLYMMNYFVAHATTTRFVQASGAPSARSATIIGAPNLSGILAAILHCFLLSRETMSHGFTGESYCFIRLLLVLSSLMGIIGNTTHALAVNRRSIPLATLGRFLFGFSSAEILQRQLLSACVSSHVVSESSRFVRFRVGGIISGFLVGSLVEMIPIRIDSIGVRALQAASWLMTLLWTIHFLRLLIHFRREKSSEKSNVADTYIERELDRGISQAPSEDYASDSSDDEQSRIKYGTGNQYMRPVNQPPKSEPTPVRPTKTASLQGWIKKPTSRLRKLLFYHVAIPICLITMFFVRFALEIFFTSCPIVTSQYFGWSGAQGGAFLTFLAALILPIYFVCETIARRFEERVLLKRSLVLTSLGLFTMINWVSMFSLAARVPKLLTETNGRLTHPYDWKIGVVQYVVGLTIGFVGLIALEGATLSLASKVSPPRLPGVLINVGTIATFLSLAARLLGDTQILMVGLSHKLINADIVNSLVLPLLFASFILGYFVKKHFFFLM